MRSKMVVFVVAAGLALVLPGTPASAQQLKKSTVTGTLTSAAGSVPNLGSVDVFTTPATGFFILTQICAQDPGGVTVSGSSFGGILLGPDECTTYTPGIALPQNETITFTDDGGGAQNVMLTGVLSKK